MFQVKDAVIYGTQGVCEIEEIAEKDLMGKRRIYYVLRPVSQMGSKVYVPVDNENSVSRMRKLLSVEEIDQLILNMTNKKTQWVENDGARKEQYKEILKEGNRESLISMIRAIYQHKQETVEKGKKLHAVDENAMREAERLLYDEFAYVLNIKREEVLPYIMDKIGR